MKWLANVWYIVKAQKYQLNTDVPMPFLCCQNKQMEGKYGGTISEFQKQKHENSATEL